MKSSNPLATPSQDSHISEAEDSEGFLFFPEEPLRFCNGRIVISKAVLLFIYVVCLILASSLNRVVFRLAQYSMVNYSYVLSQTVTLITLPIYFVVILFKLLFTDDITAKMLNFPKWKFAIMGILDGLSLLVLFTSGNFIQGILQTLLVQASVPIVMIFSLIFLRFRGNHVCRSARAIMDHMRIKYTEIYIGDEAIAKSQGQPQCRLLVNGRDIGDIPNRLKNAVPPDDDIVGIFFKKIYKKIKNCIAPPKSKSLTMQHMNINEDDDNVETTIYSPSATSDTDGLSNGGITLQGSNSTTSLSSVLASMTLFRGIDTEELIEGEVILITDGHSWKKHLRSFSIPQYVGTVVILAGVFVSVWDELYRYRIMGAPSAWLWLVFICGQIPSCLSMVYKETVFRSCPEMDVWYVNGLIIFPQVLVGFLYMPFGVIFSSQHNVDKLFYLFWQGIQCFWGMNTISRTQGFECTDQCNSEEAWGEYCCDSCDGSYPLVSPYPVYYLVLVYMVVNVATNNLILLVTKHGSAALTFTCMSAALPLSSLLFASDLIMKNHIGEFTYFTGTGLGVVILGLLIYIFVDFLLKRKRKIQLMEGSDHNYGAIKT